MTSAEIIIFKREMRLYNVYKKRVEELEESIDNKYYELSGVSGIAYDKIRYGYNEEVARKKWYKIMSQLDKLKAELDSTERKLIYLDDILDQLSELARTCLLENASGKSYYQLSLEHYKSKTSILYAINSELKAL